MENTGGYWKSIYNVLKDNVELLLVVHSVLIVAYYLIENQETNRELGKDYLDERNLCTTVKWLVKSLEQLVYRVHLGLLLTHTT
jgi:hypothetical protein